MYDIETNTYITMRMQINILILLKLNEMNETKYKWNKNETNKWSEHSGQLHGY